MSAADPTFLTLDEVLAFHQDQIRRYGGTPGIRDQGLLSSALGTVTATFGGQFLPPSLYEMAAAYLFHTLPRTIRFSTATNGSAWPRLSSSCG